MGAHKIHTCRMVFVHLLVHCLHSFLLTCCLTGAVRVEGGYAAWTKVGEQVQGLKSHRAGP